MARPPATERLDAKATRCEGGTDAGQVELSCRDIRHSTMLHGRSRLLAAALDGGRIVVVGGDAPVTAEMYEPETGWVAIAAPVAFVDPLATQLVAAGARAYVVSASEDGIRVAALDVRRRRWDVTRAPIEVAFGDIVPNVAAGVLGDGALLVTTTSHAALLSKATWERLPDPPDLGDPVARWASPLLDGGALVNGRIRLDARRQRWTQVEAPDRVIKGEYASVPLSDGRVAIVGGCSDGRECWGNAEVDVFEPHLGGAGGYETTRALLEREHSVGARGIALRGNRLIMTSDFGDGRMIEQCSVPPSVSTATCRCGTCEVPARSDFAVVHGDGDCMLSLGGEVDGAPSKDVLRYCWSDRAMAHAR